MMPLIIVHFYAQPTLREGVIRVSTHLGQLVFFDGVNHRAAVGTVMGACAEEGLGVSSVS